MDFRDTLEWTIPQGSVTQVTDSLNRVIWQKEQPVVLKNYFYVEDVSGSENTLSIKKSSGSSAPTIEVYCSTDQENWVSMGTTSMTAITATIPANSKLYLKCTADTWGIHSGATVGDNEITCSGNYNVGGNIMSLLYGDNFENQTTFPVNSDNNFRYLFNFNTTLISAANLEMPATTLTYQCYRGMFRGCTSLTTPPALPATTLAEACYYWMFSECSSLITAPELPATTLADYCYETMFYYCTSLTTAPALPATTLTQGCYLQMFQRCESLTSTPVLKATTLVDECYLRMFKNCISLNEVTTYANDISATSCLEDWLGGVAARGTFHNEGTAVYTVDSPSGIPQGWTEVSNYFYVEDISGETNTLSIKKFDADAPTVEVFYSTNRQNWTSMGNTSTTPVTATVPANSKLYLKATADTWCIRSYSDYFNVITCTGNHNVGGNIMSLLYGSNFKGRQLDNSYNRHFMNLFNQNVTLVDASDLVLPTNVADYCYDAMFSGCSSLTTAPALNATTLAPRCYYYMFSGCSSLTTAPELPATTLVVECYDDMFRGCTSLTTPPALPATTLASDCYYKMFANCSSLTTAPELPATTLDTRCYTQMFYGCTSLTTAPVLPATTLAQRCYDSMFQGCTSLNTIITFANDISASSCTTNWVKNVAATGDFYNLGSAVYQNGVNGIPSGWTKHTSFGYFYVEDVSGSDNTLTITKEYASSPTIEVFKSTDEINWTSMGSTSTTGITATIPANGKLYLKATANSWSGNEFKYNSISATGNHNVGGNIMSLLYGDDFIGIRVFPANSDRPFSHLFYGNTTLIDASDLILPVTTLTNGCYWSMFWGCTALTTPPELPATTMANSCYSGMFYGCISLTTAPALPATILDVNCYNGMFDSCSSLTTAPELPATTLVYECYVWMFNDCTSLTTAPALPATTLVGECYRQMFSGCTSLDSVITFADDISAYHCLENWLDNVANTGTLYNLGTATYATDSPSGIPTGWVQDIPVPNYFYVEDISGSNNTLSIKKSSSSAPAVEVFKSTDGDNWTSMGTTDTTAITATIPANGKLYLKATADTWGGGSGTSAYGNAITCTGNHNIGGNIMSLLYGDLHTIHSTLDTRYSRHFARLFYQDTTLVDLTDLIMPTNVTDYCYCYMFYKCTSLTTVPALPATTLAQGCYDDMFASCTGITTPPALPATTLADYCYYYMFQGCTGLTTTPALNATTIANRCYGYMFSGCTGITTPPALPATTLADYCYYYMFNNCSNLTSTPTLSATTLAPYCYAYMFQNCTGITTAPALPATTMAERCYYYMFKGCSALTTAPALSATTLADYCYAYMFQNCNNITTAPATLPATTLAQYCYYYMFSGCSSLTTAPALSATTQARYSCGYMFQNCTGITTAPTLLSQTLEQYCYYRMFYGCSNLNSVTSYANTISASQCLNGWLTNVAATGDFYNLGSASYTSGASGIPSGWTVHTSL